MALDAIDEMGAYHALKEHLGKAVECATVIGIHRGDRRWAQVAVQLERMVQVVQRVLTASTFKH